MNINDLNKGEKYHNLAIVHPLDFKLMRLREVHFDGEVWRGFPAENDSVNDKAWGYDGFPIALGDQLVDIHDIPYSGYTVRLFENFEGLGSFTDANILALPIQVHIRGPQGQLYDMKSESIENAFDTAKAIIDRDRRRS